MPRTVTLVVDRHMVGKVTPGTRVNVLGIYSTFKVRGCGVCAWGAWGQRGHGQGGGWWHCGV
jgi:DNA replicative helicase MCM subunit Mcm2 (Cdc46/Mcm family)